MTIAGDVDRFAPLQALAQLGEIVAQIADGCGFHL